MLNKLCGTTYYTKTDLRFGCHQVHVYLQDIHKTVIRTYNGYYKSLIMPFGLCNAPFTFQALVNTIFRPYL